MGERIKKGVSWEIHEAGLPDCTIAVYDAQGIITGWKESATAPLGYSSNELRGQPIARIIPPNWLRNHRSLLRRVIESGDIVKAEARRFARDGVEVPVSVTVFPIKR